MSDIAAPRRGGPGRHYRVTRPERVDIGSDEAIRNDVLAAEKGMSERTLNRGDAAGAPYLYIGGVKYRPRAEYNDYLANQIQRRGQAPRRARRVRP